MAKRIHNLIDDSELFARLARGDERAFEIIFHHYNRRLYPFILKMVRAEEAARELVQDIFVHLWLKRELLADIEHPTSYLFHVASNRTLNFMKQVSRNAQLMAQLAAGATELSYPTEERLAFRETAALIDTAVDQLPTQRKRIWELSRQEGLSHEEIAKRLGISRETVKKQITHAKRYIRRFLADRGSMLSLAVFMAMS
ncbi:RNA polymerase sigma-70 factor, ECF subfamily [Parapedobacter composti]|uniref:RNA polymerase sigma-70 factor, ECF subfamily n=1 Tax=Parapedobacter composti TaxID=623281 RepID=A0A1I1FWG8_9SPHI|nr:RNA polymerase sigma-70 factor [Parapedobacter composti]SFC03372.1 RNA polymerase sigma-70 factor, ECF subfamily [Parapedobacter composti]